MALSNVRSDSEHWSPPLLVDQLDLLLSVICFHFPESARKELGGTSVAQRGGPVRQIRRPSGFGISSSFHKSRSSTAV